MCKTLNSCAGLKNRPYSLSLVSLPSERESGSIRHPRLASSPAPTFALPPLVQEFAHSLSSASSPPEKGLGRHWRRPERQVKATSNMAASEVPLPMRSLRRNGGDSPAPVPQVAKVVDWSKLYLPTPKRTQPVWPILTECWGRCTH